MSIPEELKDWNIAQRLSAVLSMSERWVTPHLHIYGGRQIAASGKLSLEVPKENPQSL